MDDFKVVRDTSSFYEARYTSMYDIVKDPVDPQNRMQLDNSLSESGKRAMTKNPLFWLGTGEVGNRREFAASVEKTGTFTDISAEVIKRAESLPDIAPGAPKSLGQIVKRHRRRDSFGDHVDIHAINQGLLDVAWTRTERHVELATRTRVARIYIHIGGLFTEDARHSFWRAAAAIRIADALTSKGFSVEVTGGASADGVFSARTSVVVHTLFTIKSSGQPLNRERLACQATLGWHRVFCFKARACAPYRVDSGFGYTKHHTIPPYISEAREKGELVIVIPADIDSRRSAENCLANARAELELYTTTQRPVARAS